jgi:hypothetical protein
MPNIASAQALTTTYSGLSNILFSDAWIFAWEPWEPEPFNPSLAIPPAQPKFRAVWDTGSTNTAITEKVINSCNLKQTGMTIVNTAGGTFNRPTFIINLLLPSHVIFRQLKVTQAVEITGGDLLIGMDIMCQGDLAVTNKDAKTVFSFRTPSCVCTDFVKEINLARAAPGQTVINPPKIGRNALCPCGSGKKYKYCCGK